MWGKERVLGAKENGLMYYTIQEQGVGKSSVMSQIKASLAGFCCRAQPSRFRADGQSWADSSVSECRLVEGATELPKNFWGRCERIQGVQDHMSHSHWVAGTAQTCG